ncbi:hypothetical protein VNO78_02675 [Psophocarpus tetragonolobus]|uniref:Uncharacterized protein n=1 Tax=Psophocarpus tetragonolobus TaxID=3891 RepID=A0AAN9XVU9_PSOTE
MPRDSASSARLDNQPQVHHLTLNLECTSRNLASSLRLYILDFSLKCTLQHPTSSVSLGTQPQVHPSILGLECTPRHSTLGAHFGT